VLRQRAAWRRALLATLLLAQGTPQLLAGDEMGNSQQGNNNAYCQDNATSWLDWAQADEALISFVSAVTALRKRYPAFRHPRWFAGHPFNDAGHPYLPGGDIAWLRPDGLSMSHRDWDDSRERSFSYVIEVGEGMRPATERVMVLLHPGPSPLMFVLPEGPWRVALDTSTPEWGEQRALSHGYELAGPATCVLVQAIEWPSVEGHSA
jgi:glycogen operon protein